MCVCVLLFTMSSTLRCHWLTLCDSGTLEVQDRFQVHKEIFRAVVLRTRRGSAPASRWWSEILEEWHRCWPRKSNGAESLNTAALLTVMARASEIVLQPVLYVAERTFGQLQTLRSSQTSGNSVTAVKDFLWRWGVTDLLCCHHRFCRFASLVSTLMWKRLWGRKGTCEPHLVLGKFRLVFLAFIKFAWKQWPEYSRWDASVKLWECKMSACQ